MPQRFLCEFTMGPQQGQRALLWSIDVDEHLKKNPPWIKVLSENPLPSDLLIDEQTGLIKGGVLARSELEQIAVDPAAHEKFTSDQIKQLDQEHKESQAAREAATAVARQRREVSRG